MRLCVQIPGGTGKRLFSRFLGGFLPFLPINWRRKWPKNFWILNVCEPCPAAPYPLRIFHSISRIRASTCWSVDAGWVEAGLDEDEVDEVDVV